MAVNGVGYPVIHQLDQHRCFAPRQRIQQLAAIVGNLGAPGKVLILNPVGRVALQQPANRRGQDLVITMTLFGIAADWAAVATHALVTTLRQKIDWRGQRTDVFIPRVTVQDITVRSNEGIDAGPPRTQVELQFLTPMNAERDSPIMRPGTLFTRLVSRIEGLAFWHDAALVEDSQCLEARSTAVSYDVRLLQLDHAARRSGRTQQNFVVPTVSGTLWMDNLSPELWSLLVIGAETHVGKGATEGFGRYILA